MFTKIMLKIILLLSEIGAHITYADINESPEYSIDNIVKFEMGGKKYQIKMEEVE